MVQNPGIEPHIHPFIVGSKYKNQDTHYYLHTSPEFHMKQLLSEGLEKIFTLCYCFRDEPKSPIHNPQFLMLEWYRKNETYHKIMQDTEELIKASYEHMKSFGSKMRWKSIPDFQKVTISEIFKDILNINILDFLEISSLKSLIQKDFKDVPLPTIDLEWDDYFFLLYLNKIEPKIAKIPALLLYEFPHHLSALSTLKEDDPRVCERFEIYLDGIELCNSFNEITELQILKKRFHYQNQQKNKQYHYTLPEPKRFYKAMENYPKSAGIALGVERLLLSLIEIENPFWS